jgi:hypothetical protein
LKEKFPDFKKNFTQELNSLDFTKEKKTIKIDKILSENEF